MKKLKILGILTVIILLLDPVSTFAQGKIHLMPYASYMFGGKMKFYEGEFKIQDNVSYGLGADINLAPNSYLTLNWNQMSTEANFRPYYGYDYIPSDYFDVNVGYIQIGTTNELQLDNDMIKPFGSFTLGTAYFLPKSPAGDVQYDDAWKFSVTLGGGVKIWLSDVVGIRLHGRLMLPMFWGGAGFTVGSGGSGVTVGAGTSMVQGDLGLGLVIALGD